eukprot:g875.t1
MNPSLRPDSLDAKPVWVWTKDNFESDKVFFSQRLEPLQKLLRKFVADVETLLPRWIEAKEVRDMVGLAGGGKTKKRPKCGGGEDGTCDTNGTDEKFRDGGRDAKRQRTKRDEIANDALAEGPPGHSAPADAFGGQHQHSATPAFCAPEEASGPVVEDPVFGGGSTVAFASWCHGGATATNVKGSATVIDVGANVEDSQPLQARTVLNDDYMFDFTPAGEFQTGSRTVAGDADCWGQTPAFSAFESAFTQAPGCATPACDVTASGTAVDSTAAPPASDQPRETNRERVGGPAASAAFFNAPEVEAEKSDGGGTAKEVDKQPEQVPPPIRAAAPTSTDSAEDPAVVTPERDHLFADFLGPEAARERMRQVLDEVDALVSNARHHLDILISRAEAISFSDSWRDNILCPDRNDVQDASKTSTGYPAFEDIHRWTRVQRDADQVVEKGLRLAAEARQKFVFFNEVWDEEVGEDGATLLRFEFQEAYTTLMEGLDGLLGVENEVPRVQFSSFCKLGNWPDSFRYFDDINSSTRFLQMNQMNFKSGRDLASREKEDDLASKWTNGYYYRTRIPRVEYMPEMGTWVTTAELRALLKKQQRQALEKEEELTIFRYGLQRARVIWPQADAWTGTDLQMSRTLGHLVQASRVAIRTTSTTTSGGEREKNPPESRADDLPISDWRFAVRNTAKFADGRKVPAILLGVALDDGSDVATYTAPSLLEQDGMRMALGVTLRCGVPGCGCVQRCYFRPPDGLDEGNAHHHQEEIEYFILETKRCTLGATRRALVRMRDRVTHKTRYDRPQGLMGMQMFLRNKRRFTRNQQRLDIADRFNKHADAYDAFFNTPEVLRMRTGLSTSSPQRRIFLRLPQPRISKIELPQPRKAPEVFRHYYHMQKTVYEQLRTPNNIADSAKRFPLSVSKEVFTKKPECQFKGKDFASILLDSPEFATRVAMSDVSSASATAKLLAPFQQWVKKNKELIGAPVELWAWVFNRARSPLWELEEMERVRNGKASRNSRDDVDRHHDEQDAAATAGYETKCSPCAQLSDEREFASLDDLFEHTADGDEMVVEDEDVAGDGADGHSAAEEFQEEVDAGERMRNHNQHKKVSRGGRGRVRFNNEWPTRDLARHFCAPTNDTLDLKRQCRLTRELGQKAFIVVRPPSMATNRKNEVSFPTLLQTPEDDAIYVKFVPHHNFAGNYLYISVEAFLRWMVVKERTLPDVANEKRAGEFRGLRADLLRRAHEEVLADCGRGGIVVEDADHRVERQDVNSGASRALPFLPGEQRRLEQEVKVPLSRTVDVRFLKPAYDKLRDKLDKWRADTKFLERFSNRVAQEGAEGVDPRANNFLEFAENVSEWLLHFEDADEQFWDGGLAQIVLSGLLGQEEMDASKNGGEQEHGSRLQRLQAFVFLTLAEWHLPGFPHAPEYKKFNYGKLCARFQFLTSDTWETLQLQPHEIEVVDDVKGATGAVLNDGCGGMSADVAMFLRDMLCRVHKKQFVSGIVAVQVRCGPVKGMLFVDKALGKRTRKVLKPKKFCIQVPLSMVKYCPDPSQWTAGQRVIEVCAQGTVDWKPKPCARLNTQYVHALTHNGVSTEQILELQRKDVEQMIGCSGAGQGGEVDVDVDEERSLGAILGLVQELQRISERKPLPTTEDMRAWLKKPLHQQPCNSRYGVAVRDLRKKITAERQPTVSKAAKDCEDWKEARRLTREWYDELDKWARQAGGRAYWEMRNEEMNAGKDEGGGAASPGAFGYELLFERRVAMLFRDFLHSEPGLVLRVADMHDEVLEKRKDNAHYPVPESVAVKWVSDPTGLLRQYECYFEPVLQLQRSATFKKKALKTSTDADSGAGAEVGEEVGPEDMDTQAVNNHRARLLGEHGGTEALDGRDGQTSDDEDDVETEMDGEVETCKAAKAARANPNYDDHDDADCVLVGKNPSFLPTDMEKWRRVQDLAVIHAIKKRMGDPRNLMVVSAHASLERSAGDPIGGGDYDGDTVWVCWQKDLVKSFRNEAQEEQIRKNRERARSCVAAVEGDEGTETDLNVGFASTHALVAASPSLSSSCLASTASRPPRGRGRQEPPEFSDMLSTSEEDEEESSSISVSVSNDGSESEKEIAGVECDADAEDAEQVKVAEDRQDALESGLAPAGQASAVDELALEDGDYLIGCDGETVWEGAIAPATFTPFEGNGTPCGTDGGAPELAALTPEMGVEGDAGCGMGPSLKAIREEAGSTTPLSGVADDEGDGEDRGYSAVLKKKKKKNPFRPVTEEEILKWKSSDTAPKIETGSVKDLWNEAQQERNAPNLGAAAGNCTSTTLALCTPTASSTSARGDPMTVLASSSTAATVNIRAATSVGTTSTDLHNGLTLTEDPANLPDATMFVTRLFECVDALLHRYAFDTPRGKIVNLWERVASYVGLTHRNARLLGYQAHLSMDALKQSLNLEKFSYKGRKATRLTTVQTAVHASGRITIPPKPLHKLTKKTFPTDIVKIDPLGTDPDGRRLALCRAAARLEFRARHLLTQGPPPKGKIAAFVEKANKSGSTNPDLVDVDAQVAKQRSSEIQTEEPQHAHGTFFVQHDNGLAHCDLQQAELENFPKKAKTKGSLQLWEDISFDDDPGDGGNGAQDDDEIMDIPPPEVSFPTRTEVKALGCASRIIQQQGRSEMGSPADGSAQPPRSKRTLAELKSQLREDETAIRYELWMKYLYARFQDGKVRVPIEECSVFARAGQDLGLQEHLVWEKMRYYARDVISAYVSGYETPERCRLVAGRLYSVALTKLGEDRETDFASVLYSRSRYELFQRLKKWAASRRIANGEPAQKPAWLQKQEIADSQRGGPNAPKIVPYCELKFRRADGQMLLFANDGKCEEPTWAQLIGLGKDVRRLLTCPFDIATRGLLRLMRDPNYNQVGLRERNLETGERVCGLLWLDPMEIRFSQDSCSNSFSDGSEIEELVEKLKNRKMDVRDVPPIRVVRIRAHADSFKIAGGGYFSEDEEEDEENSSAGDGVSAPVEESSHWWSLDNRRLHAFKLVADSLRKAKIRERRRKVLDEGLPSPSDADIKAQTEAELAEKFCDDLAEGAGNARNADVNNNILAEQEDHEKNDDAERDSYSASNEAEMVEINFMIPCLDLGHFESKNDLPKHLNEKRFTYHADKGMTIEVRQGVA